VEPLILAAVNFWRFELWNYFGIHAYWTTSNTVLLTEYWIFVANIIFNWICWGREIC